jgi:ATP-dependent Clp protease ATP-binding subunit ClpX
VVIGPEVIEGKAKPLFIHGDRGEPVASVSA